MHETLPVTTPCCYPSLYAQAVSVRSCRSRTTIRRRWSSIKSYFKLKTESISHNVLAMLRYDTLFTSIVYNKQDQLLMSKSEDCNFRHLVDKAFNVFVIVHSQIAILLSHDNEVPQPFPCSRRCNRCTRPSQTCQSSAASAP